MVVLIFLNYGIHIHTSCKELLNINYRLSPQNILLRVRAQLMKVFQLLRQIPMNYDPISIAQSALINIVFSIKNYTIYNQ